MAGRAECRGRALAARGGRGRGIGRARRGEELCGRAVENGRGPRGEARVRAFLHPSLSSQDKHIAGGGALEILGILQHAAVSGVPGSIQMKLQTSPSNPSPGHAQTAPPVASRPGTRRQSSVRGLGDGSPSAYSCSGRCRTLSRRLHLRTTLPCETPHRRGFEITRRQARRFMEPAAAARDSPVTLVRHGWRPSRSFVPLCARPGSSAGQTSDPQECLRREIDMWL